MSSKQYCVIGHTGPRKMIEAQSDTSITIQLRTEGT
jgi:hypothetical protein